MSEHETPTESAPSSPVAAPDASAAGEAAPAPVAAVPPAERPTEPQPVAPKPPRIASDGGTVFGAELEAALEERLQQAGEEPPRYWSLRGETYQLRAYLPAGTMLAVVQAMHRSDGGLDKVGKLADALVSFFEPEAAGRFTDALTDFGRGDLPDMEYLQGTIQQLIEVFSKRPFGSANT